MKLEINALNLILQLALCIQLNKKTVESQKQHKFYISNIVYILQHSS